MAISHLLHLLPSGREIGNTERSMSTRTSGTEKVEHEGPDEQMDERYQRSSEGMMLHMQRSSPPCVKNGRPCEVIGLEGTEEAVKG
jgi:hypothetical protein